MGKVDLTTKILLTLILLALLALVYTSYTRPVIAYAQGSGNSEWIAVESKGTVWLINTQRGVINAYKIKNQQITFIGRPYKFSEDFK
ncbi:MAG: hypothetical protein J7L64_07285 [Acidobacteria bacterium]|nr:hypothetical protein [Acidobacteriota bacterium]